MITEPRPPLLRRLPAGVWVAAFWTSIVVFRFFTRAEELRHLFDYHGNTEDMPLVVTAVVTTLVAFLLVPLPLAAVAVALAGGVYSLGMWEVPVTAPVQFLIAEAVVAYCVVTRSRPVSAIATGMPLALLAGLYVWGAVNGYVVNPYAYGGLAATVLIAWLIGNTVRQSRTHAEALRGRAAEQAVTAERLRIARELHDMVAHNIGIIAIQAGMGSRVMDTQPAETRNALDAIEATSRETLAGLRRMLGALRRGEGESAPLEVAPGLAELDRLVEKTAGAGVRVALTRGGEARALPPEVDLAAFRIVQEAVTNVVKHSGTRDCQVTVEYGTERLAVTVVDLGAGTPTHTPGTGYGLAGMRERVALLHGEFSAGPRPGGGFRVAARLPIPKAPEAPEDPEAPEVGETSESSKKAETSATPAPSGRTEESALEVGP
ncbi:sensor histidine kinase [Kitasatospora cathayae]|uniref:histidine kinase n=1 Tax=Kitasatospora cathayae TaxID=3004092 RepID=A0ABY7Q2A8_9ACTN|nr:sensor histidine kinase [Kitasatospora sp. HUAS 3-15]WBP86617.1 sensor histidine kinase [Kitasatospora sp. HUAS 3-15]